MENHGGSFVVTEGGDKVLVERTDHVVSQPVVEVVAADAAAGGTPIDAGTGGTPNDADAAASTKKNKPNSGAK